MSQHGVGEGRTPGRYAQLIAKMNLNPQIRRSKTIELFSETPSGAPEPPLFTQRFQELTVPEKGTFKLVAKVTGNPVPVVAWLRYRINKNINNVINIY